MKTFFCNLFLLISLTFIQQCCFAQNSVTIDIQHIPGKTYKTGLVQSIDMEMNFKGDSAILKALIDNGQQFPVIMKMSSEMALTTKAGARRADNKVPLVMTYDKININQTFNGEEVSQTNNPFAGARVEGISLGDGKMQIDTIIGDIQPEMKNMVRNMLASVQSGIKYPSTALKVGDSFTQELPMSIPIPEAAMEMQSKLVYTLKEIRNNTAIFDIQQTISMKMDMNTINSTGSGGGSGSGTLIYDISKLHPSLVDSDINMNLEMPTSGFSIIANCHMKSTIKYEIN